MSYQTEIVELAKDILADPDQIDRKITDIAYDVGFQSVKNFNDEFRKATDMCPTEYRAFHTQFKLITGMSPEEYRKKKEE